MRRHLYELRDEMLAVLRGERKPPRMPVVTREAVEDRVRAARVRRGLEVREVKKP